MPIPTMTTIPAKTFAPRVTGDVAIADRRESGCRLTSSAPRIAGQDQHTAEGQFEVTRRRVAAWSISGRRLDDIDPNVLRCQST
jgi:hypothetical protein